jgi:exopolysaccharide biosynthesis protein
MTEKKLIFLLLCLLKGASSLAAAAEPWVQVDDGLYIGEFSSRRIPLFPQQQITIIKIDPRLYEFQLLSVSELRHPALTTEEWCKRYNLIGAVNAGMYQIDLRRHVGYMKNFNHVNNSAVNSYHSVLACHPVADSLPPIMLFDIEKQPLQEIIRSYQTVIQNLRLIKHPRQNRWDDQNKKWCEAAIGQDADGNILLIYSPKPMSMYRLNVLLLELPINIVSAQHLEGGPPASLYFSHNGRRIHFNGGEENTEEDSAKSGGLPLPNVIGFKKSKARKD